MKTTKFNLSLPANQLAIIMGFATRKDISPEKMVAEWLSDRLAVEENNHIKEKAKKNVRKNSRSANKRKARKG